MKKLATLLAVLLLLSTLFGVATVSSSADGEVTGGYGYYYNADENPIMDFVDPADKAQVGVWWWYSEKHDDALYDTNKRDMYLNFMEENSINEIYFYGYYLLQSSSARAKLHTFVQEANRRGIVISFIYDDNDTIMGSSRALDYVCDEYLRYVGEYPDDKLNGIHFDVEHEKPEDFANKLVSQFQNARDRGVPISMDVNCAMDINTRVSAGGVTGNIYEVIAGNVDTLTLMSYKDTYEKIWKLGANAFAAAKKYGCRVVFAVETGDYSSGAAPHYETFNDPADEFAQETKEYLYGELVKLYESLQADHPTGGFGVAVHQHEDWYNLQKSPTPITTDGTGKTEKPTVSHASISTESTATTKKTQRTPLEETVLWSGDVNQTVTIGRPDAYTGRLSGAVAEEINAAIRDDLAKKGTITGDEYYEIITTGSSAGNSGYATTGFVVNGDGQLWTEGKVAGTSLIQDTRGTYAQRLYGTTTDKPGNLLAPQMNETTELVYFSDASGYTDTCTVDSLVVKVYRHAPYTGTETESAESSATESSATESGATESSATESSATESSATESSATESSATESSATESSATATETATVTATGATTTATAAESLLGDANDDGFVNMKDVLLMRKALSGMSVSLNAVNADVNVDNAVNMKDVLAIRKFLAGLILSF